MGEAGGLKRVASCTVPRQAWPRVTAPQKPAVPTDLHQGQERPFKEYTLRSYPAREQGWGEDKRGTVSHRERKDNSQEGWGRFTESEEAAIQASVEPGPGPGRAFGTILREAVCWPASPGGHVCSPRPRLSGEELGVRAGGG